MATTKAKKKPRRQALVVLGMHRSGTSAISGMLSLLGAHAPRSLMEPTKDNPRGYWESVEVMKANERVLSSAGSRWNDWGAFNPDWFDSSIAEQLRGSLVELIEKEYGSSPLLLVKDPRISRFLPLWLGALEEAGIQSRIVIPVRHPLGVARSLEVRDHFGRNRSLLLWLRHVLDAEASSRQLPRSFVRYDSVLADWQAQARRVGRDLDVVWPKWSGDTEVKIGDFLSSELRHHPESDETIAGTSDLAEWVRHAYEALLQACEGPLEQATLHNLDRIRSDFNRSSAVYAPVVREHELRVEALYADMKAKLALSVEERQGQASSLAEAERILSETREALAEQRREAEALKARIDVEEQSKVQQKNFEEQLALNAAAGKQAVELAAAEHVARLAEHENRHARAAQEHAEVVARLAASEAEVLKLHADAKEHEAALQEHVDTVQRLRAAEERSAAASAGHSRQLAEKDQAIAELTDRIGAMKAQEAAATREHQLQLEKLEKRLLAREEEVARFSGELSKLKSSMAEQSVELSKARTAAETSANVRFRETAKLTEMLFEKERAVVEQAQRHARETAALEYRNAFIRSTLSQQAGAWEHKANTYAQVLGQLGASRAWKILARTSRIRLPDLQAPDLDGVVDSQVETLLDSELFDERWYLAKYPDAAESAMEPQRHYLLVGAPAGYNPGPAFDSVAYLMEYPDVRDAGVNPLVHYVRYGRAESRTRVAPVEAQA